MLLCLVPATLRASPPSSPPGHTKRPPLPPGKGGNGHGTGGRTALPPPPPGGGTGSPTSAVVLAAWLDDAETLARGDATIGVSAGYSKYIDGSETDAPLLFGAVGLASRVQLSGSVPYYHASYDDGYSASGLGNTYLACKVKLIDAATHRVGLAVSPVLEILSDAALSDSTLGLSRVNWALPLSAQWGQGATRVIASTGYFSRGALFLAAGVDRAVSSQVTLTGAFSYSYSTSSPDASDLAGLSRSRLDLTGAVVVRLTPSLSLSGALGRTVSSLDQNGATLLASASLSYAFVHARPGP